MIIEDNRNEANFNIEDIESGTLVRYRINDISTSDTYYGIVLQDMDYRNTIIYDIYDGVYYNDFNDTNYTIVEILDNVKIVIE